MKYIVKYFYNLYDYVIAYLICGAINLAYFIGWPLWNFNFQYDKELWEEERQINYWVFNKTKEGWSQQFLIGFLQAIIGFFTLITIIFNVLGK